MRSAFAWSPRLATLAVAGSALIAGCLKSTEPQPSSLQLAGTWSYTGEQTGPVRESLAGTLTITGESGTSFQGRLDLVGTNSQTGETRALTGLVSGAQSGAVVDFDASLEATPRRHVGQIKADTITGSWVGDGTSGAMASGTFRVERESR
ncbi:MAG TPA: hypothetical protein VFK26_00095 [Gemmatimonadaceae bacterium]|jgi:hypothetical protein|nr:hypothetical protein [Gemmatimonadaceae bacterium]